MSYLWFACLETARVTANTSRITTVTTVTLMIMVVDTELSEISETKQISLDLSNLRVYMLKFCKVQIKTARSAFSKPIDNTRSNAACNIENVYVY